MRTRSFGSILARWALALVVCVFSPFASAQTPPAYVFSSPLLPLLLQMPQNSWVNANANLYSNVWTPSDLEPLYGCCAQPPSKIIAAWSGFAWDSNRGDLILFGGGHANYPGNDIYRWHSSNLLWERASLPSEIKTDPLLQQIAIDGVDNAPISSHTYDNNLFLPVADRFLTWGGAAFNNGGPFIRPLESNPTTQTRLTGPYLFDPNRADGSKVGGSTGSHVQRVAPHPEIVGGQMWQNRDIHYWLAGQPLPGTHINGCTGYATEGGRDVVYVASAPRYSTALSLYRYQLNDLANPAADQIAKVGAYAVGVSGQTTCGYDPVRKVFVRTGNNTVPFQFWDLTSAGPANADQNVQVNASIAALQAWLSANAVDIQFCALEYDPNRGRFVLWCGADVIWEMTPPVSGNTTTGWTATQRPAPPQPAPPGDLQTGVLGKWRYAPYYDVFIGLQGINDGDIWIYKPVGWVQPNPIGNALPVVSITSPPIGITVAPATPINMQAAASDSDGSIVRVEYYVNGDKVGQATSPPYTVGIAPIFVGSYSVVAIAVDNVGGMTASVPVTFTVSATLTTSVLQRGLNGYAGASDTYLDNYLPTTARGGLTALYLDPVNYNPLIRFAIFQSEGGPVPNGAVIQSATLALYKQFYDDTLRLNALLKPWVESQATWTISQTGTPWTAGGAAGAGSDYNTTTDALVTGSFNPGWISFDVTSRVQQWGSSGANYGWRMAQTTAGGNSKVFNSSEYTADTTLRPKLTVVYSVPTNQPPTVSITTPAPGAAVTLGQSFTLTSSANDTDGTVTKVDYYANGVPIGTAATAPYTLVWTPGAVASYSLVAVATDNGLATTTSAAVNVTVIPVTTGTTVVLQRGLNGYAGVSDTFLDRYLPTTVRDGLATLYVDPVNYNTLIRFAIFQSEGGPVPDGATIQSATLALYKQYYDDPLRLNALLKPWVESQATWSISQTGVPWSAGGAAGAGIDYSTTTDALVAGSFNPGWVNFDVTSRVQQWGSSGANYGWRMAAATAGYETKVFNASEYTTDTTLRPKLTIVYSVPTTTTVVLQRGLNSYAGVSDTFLDRYLPTTVRDGLATLYVDPVNYNPLIRFAIFQSEGGPLPDGAVIQSATLAVYKQYYDDPLQLNALLKPWVEGQATWTVSQTGAPWSAGGAAGAGSDYSTTTDALVSGSFNPGWVSFDVTSRVQQWSSGGANYGWRMAQTTAFYQTKVFNSSEYTTDTTLRPKLTIVYSVPTTTTVVLQRGLNGYAGVGDTYLDRYLPTTVNGGSGTLYLDPVNYNTLIRFAIFQSEGGPVPNGAAIQSATLALYKEYYDDPLRLNALLKPWVEGQATWTVSQTGVPWSAGGAAGAGTDYSTSSDALVAGTFNPGWVSFDVTPRVQQWASGGANYGWRMAQTTAAYQSKVFTSSEGTIATLRPRLTVVYSAP